MKIARFRNGETLEVVANCVFTDVQFENLINKQDFEIKSANIKNGSFLLAPKDDATTFESGAIRDSSKIPEFSDLIFSSLRRLALIHTEGVKKYGRQNYRKGLPREDTINHLLNHLCLYLEGDRTEDHLAKTAFGIFDLMFEDDVESGKVNR